MNDETSFQIPSFPLQQEPVYFGVSASYGEEMQYYHVHTGKLVKLKINLKIKYERQMLMNPLTFYTLDVFTKQLFGGNQLAVIPESPEIPDHTMQKIANEFNLSETVFVSKPQEDGSFNMRIFTPTRELPTAGHPTIGTSHLLSLLYPEIVNKQSLNLNQKVGNIRVDLAVENNTVSKATMFQVLPEFLEIFQERQEIAKLLSLEEADLHEAPIQKVSCGVPYVIVPVRNIESIRNIRFRLDLWDSLSERFNQAFVYAFTLEGELEGSNVHGRMFAPEAGILEDPATGSANGPLGCYITHYDLLPGPYVSEQGFEMGRPSILEVDIEKSGTNITAVKVSGSSILVSKGTLFPR